LPNVGKSTLFNALTSTQAAEAANYPFCTIEPNVAKVAVSDARLRRLAQICRSAKTIPMQVDLIDIAGLVEGASKGAGLGNKFLGHVRSVNAILQVVRCYEDSNITHVDDSIDPVRDLETIGTELMLADLESVEKRLAAKKGKKKLEGAAARIAEMQDALLPRAYEALQAGIAVRAMDFTEEESLVLPTLQLLSSKPMLIICNVDEDSAVYGNAHTKAVADHIASGEAGQVESLPISAKLEMEISELADEREREEYLEEMGLGETGLERILQASTRLLGLQSFYTVGPTEARSWTIPVGCTAAAAAGVIHSDMERGFIKVIFSFVRPVINALFFIFFLRI